jgi:hypothetical protein
LILPERIGKLLYSGYENFIFAKAFYLFSSDSSIIKATISCSLLEPIDTKKETGIIPIPIQALPLLTRGRPQADFKIMLE